MELKRIEVKFKKLVESATIPTYAHDGDLGMDLYCTSIEYDEEHDLYKYHTGLAIETDNYHGVILLPRSSNVKQDVYLPNSLGLIDTPIYRGEIILGYKSRISLYERANIVGVKAFMKSLVEGLTPAEAMAKCEEAKQVIYQLTKNLEFAPYKVGDRIGQMVAFERSAITPIEFDELSDTARGTGGFGSTGH